MNTEYWLVHVWQNTPEGYFGVQAKREVWILCKVWGVGGVGCTEGMKWEDSTSNKNLIGQWAAPVPRRRDGPVTTSCPHCMSHMLDTAGFTPVTFLSPSKTPLIAFRGYSVLSKNPIFPGILNVYSKF